ncbi:MAG: hypothetical protein KGI54_16355 [Pseudomonadota bacterium]|nr:hypothetical protein [Pseudomonadota bacterium]
MKIKITQAGRPSYWYSSRVGEVFDVSQADEDDYEVTSGDEEKCYIAKEDCEIVQEEIIPKQWLVIEQQGSSRGLEICILVTGEQSTDKFDVAEGARIALQAAYPSNKYFVVEIPNEEQ